MLILQRYAADGRDTTYLFVPGLPEPIRVVVVRAEGGRVYLGFDAPPEVVIYRAEIAPQGLLPQELLPAGEIPPGDAAHETPTEE